MKLNIAGIKRKTDYSPNHISNGGIGLPNLGVESLSVILLLPAESFFK